MCVHVMWMTDNSRLTTWTGPYLSIAKSLVRKGVKTSVVGYYNLVMPMSRILAHPAVYWKIANTIAPAIRNPKSRLGFIGSNLGKLEATKLEVILRREKVDFVLTFGYYEGLPSAARRSGSTSVLWSIDDPSIHCREWFEYASQFDYVLTYSLGSVPIYKSRGMKVHWFRPCIDQDYYFKAEQPQQDLDFSFTGSYLVDRETGHAGILLPLVQKYGRSVHLFGRGWEKIQGCSVHGPVDWRKIPGVNQRSRIVLSIHREPHRLHYCSLSSRVYEALGSCSFLLGDYPLGLDELFEPGKDLVAIKEESPLEVAEYYLNNPEERRKIAENGYRKVINRDTANHRADFLIKEIFGK